MGSNAYSVEVNREAQHMLKNLLLIEATQEVGVVTSTGQHHSLGKDPSFIHGMNLVNEIAEGVISDRFNMLDQLTGNPVDLFEEDDLQELDQYL